MGWPPPLVDSVPEFREFEADSARYLQVVARLIDALLVAGEVTVSVSLPFHGGLPGATLSLTVTPLGPTWIVEPLPDDQ
jgi:hypothetical protein